MTELNETIGPLDDIEYPVILGQSLVSYREQTNDIDAGRVLANEEESDTTELPSNAPTHISFRYEFQPASVDPTSTGLVRIMESNAVQVMMGTYQNTTTSIHSSFTNGIQFKGKLIENKDIDCILLFDGTSFRLERCNYSCTQLRHVRTTSTMKLRNTRKAKRNDIYKRITTKKKA